MMVLKNKNKNCQTDHTIKIKKNLIKKPNQKKFNQNNLKIIKLI